MKTLYKVSLIALFLGFSSEAISQRITVRRSDGTIEDTRESIYESTTSDHQPYAAKLHVSNILFGEYLGSVEYAVTDYFTIEGGIGATSHGANLFAGMDLLFVDFPSDDYESRGLGFSYIAEARLYSDEDALEDDSYYGIGIHSKQYNYGQLLPNVSSTQLYDASTRFRDYYLFYGYSMEFGDNLLAQLNVDIGIRDIVHQGYRDSYNSSTGGYEVAPYEDDDIGYLYGVHLTIGYVFK